MSDSNFGGMFGNVALLDIASMHPSSIEAMNLFGPYTKRFSDIKQARVDIKHKNLDKARTRMDGALANLLQEGEDTKALAGALKIVINSVYGLTSAKFPNKFNDVAAGKADRNLDNKVAKRGALFMIKLKHEVQKRGYTVVHIKTDSIKIADADNDIIDFVMDFGHKYGYNFEHEATYDKLCIVNKAVYVAHSIFGEHVGEWTATGTQFIQPYVFKTLFSHEPVGFEDMCEAKSATSSLYLDFNENLPEGEHNYSFVGKVGGFCPIKPGYGGGELVRQSSDGTSYSYAAGCKGWRWKESSIVRDKELYNEIDRRFYDQQCEAAIETISQYGDWDWFVSDEPYISPNPKSNEMVEGFKKG